MRFPLLLIISLLITPATAFAQGPELTEASPEVEVQAAPDQRPEAKMCYLIELVEFRLSAAPSPSLEAEEILNRLPVMLKNKASDCPLRTQNLRLDGIDRDALLTRPVHDLPEDLLAIRSSKCRRLYDALRIVMTAPWSKRCVFYGVLRFGTDSALRNGHRPPLLPNDSFLFRTDL